MNSVTFLEDDIYTSREVPIRKEKGKTTTSVQDSLMSSAQRRKLADITNLQDHKKQLNRVDTQQQENMVLSSKDYAEKLQKENMTLLKALAHRNKIIELSGVEFQKLRISLRNVQEKNLQLAQANSNMLAELNTSKDRLKVLQHELICKNLSLNSRKVQLKDQSLPCTQHTSNDKVPSKVSDGDCKPGINHKDTKRKRTSRIKPTDSSKVKPVLVKENSNSKRKVPEVTDTTGIPEVIYQTKDDIRKGDVSQEANQIDDNIVDKKPVVDAAKPVKDSAHNKRQCIRRKSTRFDVQETERTKKLLETDDAKETKETARIPLRRQSARLRPEIAKLCKSFHEGDEVKETIKKRRVSSGQSSATFDFQEHEVTETLNADDAGSLVNEGSRSKAVEPPESVHDTKDTNRKRRVSTRRQSTREKPQTTTDTDGGIKETATDPINIVQEHGLRSTSVSEEDERESKNNPKADETEGMMRRTSVGRPSRHAAEKIQSYREVSLKVKMRR